jgi:hypothetical protein
MAGTLYGLECAIHKPRGQGNEFSPRTRESQPAARSLEGAVLGPSVTHYPICGGIAGLWSTEGWENACFRN